MSDEEARATLVTLFREAGRAHHQAYIESDGDDPDWPIWYADHLLEPLQRHLSATFTRSELTYLLVLVSREQALIAPGADWATYYADAFAERYGL